MNYQNSCKLRDKTVVESGTKNTKTSPLYLKQSMNERRNNISISVNKKINEKEPTETEEDDKKKFKTEEQRNENTEETTQEEETEQKPENKTQIKDVNFNIYMEQSHSNSTSAITILNIKNPLGKNCNLGQSRLVSATVILCSRL